MVFLLVSQTQIWDHKKMLKLDMFRRPRKPLQKPDQIQQKYLGSKDAALPEGF